MYTIKEVAEKTRVSEHTIRFWAKSDFSRLLKEVTLILDYLMIMT